MKKLIASIAAYFGYVHKSKIENYYNKISCTFERDIEAAVDADDWEKVKTLVAWFKRKREAMAKMLIDMENAFFYGRIPKPTQSPQSSSPASEEQGQ